MLINRRYAINDYEFYGQDTWRVKPSLTVTYGLRWVLEAPPDETNGLQVAPCVQASGGGCSNQNLGDWFNHTAQLMSQGQPANNAGDISFELGGPVNHGSGLWNWDHKDFSPRIAVAWAPDTGEGWISKILGKKDQFSVRGGYSIMYDHFGIPIVNTFDQHGSFGLSTDLGDSAGSVTAWVGPALYLPHTDTVLCILSCLPPACLSLNDPGCLFGPTPSGGFPVTPSNTAFAINWGLDQSLKTPYLARLQSLTVSRQISSRSSLQISYVGSIGRRLPMQVDLGMPTNLTDPSSGMTYFQAATMLSKQAAAGVDVTADRQESIADHFGRAPDLEAQLSARGNDLALAAVRAPAELASVSYVRQDSPRGLGHAVLCAAEHIGDEPFAVLLGDDLIDMSEKLLSRMIAARQRYGGSIVALMEVPRDQISGATAAPRSGRQTTRTSWRSPTWSRSRKGARPIQLPGGGPYARARWPTSAARCCSWGRAPWPCAMPFPRPATPSQSRISKSPGRFELQPDGARRRSHARKPAAQAGQPPAEARPCRFPTTSSCSTTAPRSPTARRPRCATIPRSSPPISASPTKRNSPAWKRRSAHEPDERESERRAAAAPAAQDRC